MAIVQVQLMFTGVLNISAQVGDVIYFSVGGGVLGGFDETNVGFTSVLGPITAINGSTITVVYDDNLVPFGVSAGDYISFAKDKVVNTSSLLGYYADVNFVNDSKSKVELFSVGSDITESSK